MRCSCNEHWRPFELSGNLRAPVEWNHHLLAVVEHEIANHECDWSQRSQRRIHNLEMSDNMAAGWGCVTW